MPLQRYLMQLYWLCVLPLLLLAAWLAYDSMQAIRSAQDQEARSTVRNFAAAVDQHLAARTDALRIFAHSPLLGEPDQLDQLYREAQILKTSIGLDVALVESTQTRRVLFTTQAPLGAKIPDAPWDAVSQAKALAARAPTVGDRLSSAYSQQPIVEVVVPVVREGQSSFAVVSPIETRFLQQLLDRHALPEGWEMSLLDGHGQRLASTRSPALAEAPEADAPNRFEMPSGMARWNVRLEIPAQARLEPIRNSGLVLGAMVAGATLAGAMGGLAGGRRLRRAVASLTQDEIPPDLHIAEVDEAKAVLTATAEHHRLSEARFRRLFQDAPISMRLIDIDGRILAQNAKFESMFGYTLEDTPTLHVWMEQAYRDPVEHKRVEAAWQAMMSRSGMSTHAVFADEFGITTKSGDKRLIQVRGGLLADGLLATFIDVTEQRQAETSLRLWAETFKRARLCLAITDPVTQTILEANPEFARSCGYQPGEMVGMPVADLFPPDLRESIQAFMSPPTGQSHFTFESEHIRKDGSRFPVLSDVTLLLDEEGRPTSSLTQATDLTERRRAQSELQALHASLEQRVADRTAQLSRANQELDSFAYSVSHDLRAPVRTIEGYLQVLKEDHGADLPADVLSDLEQIGAATSRMTSLIEGLLTLSKNSRQELQLTEVDLSALVSRRLDELAHSDPGRRVTTEIQPSALTTGDPRMLEVLMTNLVDNAWKYTSKAEAPRIRFFSYEKDGHTWFCVSDNGAGFDPTHSEKLFEPFHRMHRQEEFPGIGIGLATVHRIVQRHGGQIVAEASPGRGATFGFTLNAHALQAIPAT